MPKLIASIEPQQDLHGYDSPWVGGSGKNKLPINSLSISGGGITAIIDRDSNNNVVSVTVNGTASGTVYVILNTFTLPSGTYTMSGCPSNGGTDSYRLYDDKHTSWADNGSGASFTLSEASQVAPTIRIASGYTVNNLKFYPMIEVGSQKTTFAPYSNECPISGWTACNVVRTGKNLAYSQTNNTVVARAKKGVTYTLSFDGTNKGANIKKNTSTGDKVATGANPLTFTADEDFDIFLNAWNSEFTNLQVEVGSSATTYEEYNGNTYTINFVDGSNPLTVYGGMLDVIKGTSGNKKTLGFVDLGTLSWSTQGNPNTFQAVVSDMLTPSDNIMCSHYPTTPASTSGANMPDKSIKTYGNSSAKYIIVKDSTYSDVTTFKTAMDGVQLVYELETPITFESTSTPAVKSLLGVNNIFADTGEVDVQIWTKEVTS